jgi:D-glutamate N-acetyltransferase
MTLKRIQLKTPYLLFIADVGDQGHAKTGHGIAHWRPELCAGQMRLPGCGADLGLPELDVAAAIAAGVGTVIIGVASTGGVLPDNWVPPLAALARAGIDVAAGTHVKLSDKPELVAAAKQGGATLTDVRVPPAGIAVGRGARRSGKRVLMVGTDCAVGKKYSALALHREFVQRGVKADFRATGQTGIMIAGEGMPIDAVVADFISGAAEELSPDNDHDHWDVIEGQGALLHPSYAGVSLGLLHGSQPDAVVLCHDVERTDMLGLEGVFEVPPLDEVIDIVLTSAHVTNPACIWAGISVNTSSLGAEERRSYLDDLASKYGLPCVDPVAIGMADIADYLLAHIK